MKFTGSSLEIPGGAIILAKNGRLARNFEWGARKFHFESIRNFWDFGSEIGPSEKNNDVEKCWLLLPATIVADMKKYTPGELFNSFGYGPHFTV